MSLYIDVTRLSDWDGRYTGMERFAFEITRNLLKTEVDVRLCVFDKEKGFLELQKENYSINEGRLEISFSENKHSLKKLLLKDQKNVIRELKRHAKISRNRKILDSIVLSSENTLLIYDGLWDKDEYIQAVKSAADTGIKLAHVVHDLVPIVVPHVCFEFVSQAFRNYFVKVAPKIDTLISISQNTENDFLRFFGKTVKSGIKRVIIRHGEDFGTSEPKPPHSLNIARQKFVLCVGTIEIRKNHQLLYQAYRQADAECIDLPKLVIVGREGWMSEPVVRAIRNDPAIKDKFILAGPVDDRELAWLYQNCLFTVFPAIYEGWGLPVAESLYYGKVCAASNSSSVPEIGGGLNLYYSPYDSRMCLNVLRDLTVPSSRKKLETHIRAKYKTTSWYDTARVIVNNCAD